MRLLGTMTTEPLYCRIEVVRTVIFSTVPSIPLTSMISPTRMSLDRISNMPEMKLEAMSFTAKPSITPTTPMAVNAA